MKKFIAKFPNTLGIVVYGFENDILCYFSNEAVMENNQKEWISRHAPLKTEGLNHLKDLSKCTISEVPEDLSFTTFWSKYGKKINRKRCEHLWAKMSDSQRSECLGSIPAYDAFLKRTTGRPKLDPENYLRKESWTNNWASL